MTSPATSSARRATGGQQGRLLSRFAGRSENLHQSHYTLRWRTAENATLKLHSAETYRREYDFGDGAPHRINITNTCRRSYYSSNARNRRSPPSVVAFDRRRYKLTGYQLWTSHLAQLARTHVMSVFRRSCVTPPKTRSFQRPCARPPATRKSTPSFSAYSAITEASDRPLAGRC